MGGNSILISKGCHLHKVRIDISGENNRVIIGEDCLFHSGGWIRMRDKNGLVSIGKNLNTSQIFIVKDDNDNKIIIGNDCLFSANIIIRSSDSHSILELNTNKRINYGANVVIGDRVWIGYGVNILKGSIIANDSIVGTQSVVSGREFPPNSLIVGIPGKVVKSNIYWDSNRL